MNLAAFISLIILLAAVTLILQRLRVKTGITYRSALVVLIASVAAGLVIIECPLCYAMYSDVYPGTNPIIVAIFAFLQGVQNTMRTFVLDGSWDELLTDVPKSVNISQFATTVGLILNVTAPILTFSAILTLFKELTSRIRLRFMASRNRPLFLFSELNKNTLFLAEDIRREMPDANLVYTDVYPEDDELNYELREKAGRLHAIMLRTDISELSIKDRSKLGRTEYFLLGHDEEENVMQARKLYAKNHGRSQTGIYVLAASKGNALHIDSLTANLTVEDLKEKDDYESAKEFVRSGGIMRLRRIDPYKKIAWNEIPTIMTIRDTLSRHDVSRKETLSILIFADTLLSFAIIKTLLWYCQSDKYRLVLNVVYGNYGTDKDSVLIGQKGDLINVREMLEFECPDIIATNKKVCDGDAFYDIEFIENTEFESGRIQTEILGLLEKESTKKRIINKRLLDTDLIIIDRGNDGASIETAAYFRTLFKRIKKNPEILAVCDDEEEILHDLKCNNFITHKGASYNIGFIGRRCDTYRYKSIINIDEENLGFCQHIKWVDRDSVNKEIRPEDLDAKLIEQLINYEKHEYYRESSISKAMYLRNVLADPNVEVNIGRIAENDSTDDDNTRFERQLAIRPEYECLNNPIVPSDRWLCTCERCRLRRKLEHNRWNAYMRTEGYVLNTANIIGGEEQSIAKVHYDLIPFDDLPENERDKDG